MIRLMLCCALFPALLGILGAQDPAALEGAPKLIEQLGSPDFETRKTAAERLRALGEAARPALQAARSDADLERRMRVRALLEDLDAERRANGHAPKQKRRGQVLRPVQPRDSTRRPEISEPQRVRPYDRIEEMRRIEEETRRILEGLVDERLGPRPSFDMPFLGSEKWQINPTGGTMVFHKEDADGTKLELRRDANGEITVEIEEDGEIQRHSAKNAEEFKAQHPELYARFQGTGAFAANPFQFAFPPQGLFEGRFTVIPPTRIQPMAPTLPGPSLFKPNDRQLGIICSSVAERWRQHLKLDGRGVVVERVLEGSLAAQLGLRTDDILLSVNGKAVAAPAEVTAGLNASEAATPTVEILRAGSRLTLEAPSAEAEESAEKK